jgi:host factor-I protein
MEAAKQAIEPQFLARALAQGVKLRIGQMNRTEYEGIVREIGRYEINIESRNHLITLLKKDISHLSAPEPLLAAPAHAAAEVPAAAAQEGGAPARPNIQQEFLDKAIREGQALTLFLITGQRIRATIEAYDNFTLLIREGDRQHLYYKHAITTINR